MRRLLIAIAVTAVVGAACSSSSSTASSGGTGGPVTIEFWHGQIDTAKTAIESLVEEFNSTHDDVQVEAVASAATAEEMLPKVTTAIAAGTYPDVAYMFGSWGGNLAKSDKIADISSYIDDPDINWDDFWEAARNTVTVDGKVLGFPAIIDNLSVIYNKDLFDAAGEPYPSPDWTWEDFEATALRMTDLSKGIYGVNYPISGSEDTVWRYWPFLWQAGGEVLNEDETQAAFNSPEGVTALELWRKMAVDDGSVYLDVTENKAEPKFIGDTLSMFVSGPWEVYTLNEAKKNWGVVPLPSYDGVTHETIAGPDMWAVFNRDEAHVAASVEFLNWLSQPEQAIKWMLESGSLPLRESMIGTPEYDEYVKAFPGIETMIDNLNNAKHVRPAVPQYPRISEAMGQAITAVLLGQKSPTDALNEAADQTNALLAVPT
jgi:ABC-type glycerol-3-phosphate transport system substrate-binding protein